MTWKRAGKWDNSDGGYHILYEMAEDPRYTITTHKYRSSDKWIVRYIGMYPDGRTREFPILARAKLDMEAHKRFTSLEVKR